MEVEDLVGKEIKVKDYIKNSFFGCETRSLLIEVDGEEYELYPRKLNSKGDVNLLDIKHKEG